MASIAFSASIDFAWVGISSASVHVDEHEERTPLAESSLRRIER